VKYLLDTCTVSDYFRRRGAVAARLHALPPYELAVSSLTEHEMRYGVARMGAGAQSLLERVASFLRVVSVLPFDRADAVAAAELRARLDGDGRGIGTLDSLIAGVAVARDLVLVTSNVREFSRVEGLAVENWR